MQEFQGLSMMFGDTPRMVKAGLGWSRMVKDVQGCSGVLKNGEVVHG